MRFVLEPARTESQTLSYKPARFASFAQEVGMIIAHEALGRRPEGPAPPMAVSNLSCRAFGAQLIWIRSRPTTWLVWSARVMFSGVIVMSIPPGVGLSRISRSNSRPLNPPARKIST